MELFLLFCHLILKAHETFLSEWKAYQFIERSRTNNSSWSLQAFDSKFRLCDANLILNDKYFSDKCGRQIDLTFIAAFQGAPLLQNSMLHVKFL